MYIPTACMPTPSLRTAIACGGTGAITPSVGDGDILIGVGVVGMVRVGAGALAGEAGMEVIILIITIIIPDLVRHGGMVMESRTGTMYIPIVGRMAPVVQLSELG